MNRRGFLSLSALGLMAGCTPTEIRRGITSGQAVIKGDVKGAVTRQLPSTGVAELDQLFRRQLGQLIDELEKHWTDKKVATPKEYVKYTDKYLSRAIINFETGRIRVETVDSKTPKASLKKAIVSTLLTPDDPSKVDLLSDKPIKTGQEPFLYQMVVDQDRKAIRYAWRANRYADYLMTHQFERKKQGKQTVFAVTFDMVSTHERQSQTKYASSVKRQSRRFNIEEALVYAIIETESAFNPYAMSHIPAYGLMQIVPSSAGADAHQLLYKKPGIPTKNYLFQPNNNVEMGTAYLSILFTRYLKAVKHPKSREYCCIAAYNTGSGNVLKAFDQNRSTAFTKINRLSPDQVYQHLRTHLKYEEARNYLKKVTRNKTKYLS